jgi:hypothetical protein
MAPYSHTAAVRPNWPSGAGPRSQKGKPEYRNPSGSAQTSVLVYGRRMPRFTFVRLMALRASARCPQNAGEERPDNHGYHDKRGTDIHAPRVPSRLKGEQSPNGERRSGFAFHLCLFIFCLYRARWRYFRNAHQQRTHHVVFFVFENVAVPHVFVIIELVGRDAGPLARRHP